VRPRWPAPVGAAAACVRPRTGELLLEHGDLLRDHVAGRPLDGLLQLDGFGELVGVGGTVELDEDGDLVLLADGVEHATAPRAEPAAALQIVEIHVLEGLVVRYPELLEHVSHDLPSCCPPPR